MKLYHGSDVIVKNPKIIQTEKGKDFGYAFYLTPIKEQAERMAKRKQRINQSKQAIVNVYEWDTSSKTTLKYKNYPNANIEWLEMVINCRTNTKPQHNFDIVEGKIADDAVGETILYVIDKIITVDEALKRLKFQKINSQIAFCSNESLKTIKFIESYKIK